MIEVVGYAVGYLWPGYNNINLGGRVSAVVSGMVFSVVSGVVSCIVSAVVSGAATAVVSSSAGMVISGVSVVVLSAEVSSGNYARVAPGGGKTENKA
ncbi:MAG TPA: hypothetical protein GX011_02655 [Clostridiales bacterium]|nr:hypothetical protein [Clostridiales bacterium]